jgi:hypothetical protein
VFWYEVLLYDIEYVLDIICKVTMCIIIFLFFLGSSSIGKLGFCYRPPVYPIPTWSVMS